MLNDFRTQLLSWYFKEQRTLPWRATKTNIIEPYHTWLSEIMLQQTTVATVKPYFQDFVKRWPAVFDLANAELDDVLTQWQGLGYYSRARNLHKCAKMVVEDYEGDFPSQADELIKLPGIGKYTAAAISSIAFSQATVPVDGNVIRVFSRIFGIKETPPQLLRVIEDKALDYAEAENAGDFAQALMDLGATVCKPKNPQCDQCPMSSMCYALKHDYVESLPFKAAKIPKPTRKAIGFLVENNRGEILLRKRPAKGLLAGMLEIPTTPWSKSFDDVENWEQHQPMIGEWQKGIRKIKHTFTHFHLETDIWTLHCKDIDDSLFWVHKDKLGDHPLPTLTKKMIYTNQD